MANGFWWQAASTFIFLMVLPLNLSGTLMPSDSPLVVATVFLRLLTDSISVPPLESSERVDLRLFFASIFAWMSPLNLFVSAPFDLDDSSTSLSSKSQSDSSSLSSTSHSVNVRVLPAFASLASMLLLRSGFVSPVGSFGFFLDFFFVFLVACLLGKAWSRPAGSVIEDRSTCLSFGGFALRSTFPFNSLNIDLDFAFSFSWSVPIASGFARLS